MHTSLERTIDYIEIPSRDLAASKQFFSALFGWHFVDYGPDYASFDDGRTVGGFFTSEKVAAIVTGSVLVVFYQSDLEACQAKVQSLGGRITKEVFSFPGGRRFHFAEPGGGEFAVWSEK